MRMPTGRFEQRIAKTEVVGLLHLDGSSTAKVEAFTENVSPRGARVINDSVCAPGKLVRLDASEEQVNLLGRVECCQHVGDGKFGVDLRHTVRVVLWYKQ